MTTELPVIDVIERLKNHCCEQSIVPSFLIGFFSFLQVTRTIVSEKIHTLTREKSCAFILIDSSSFLQEIRACIKALMGFNFNATDLSCP